MSAAYPVRSPWWYLPTLYFQQGVPVMIVQALSVAAYKKLGVPNDQIGLWTSLITWPWILKLLWSPFIDTRLDRRRWVLLTQLLITAALVIAALAFEHASFLPLTLAVFFGIAFLSATHDIALDGWYMLALPRDRQAFFVGVRSAAFRLAMIFCTGTLVMVAGRLEERGLPAAAVWRNTLLLGAGVYAALLLYALRAMPRAPLDVPAAPAARDAGTTWLEIVRSYFRQPGALVIVLFILLYRFGESMLGKMVTPFLLDPRAEGGLELSTVQLGAISGTVGPLCLTAGGLLGGVAISRLGLRRCLWPMILSMNVPNLFYLWAAHAQPGAELVYPLIAVDQFGYGFGMAALSVYTMYASQASRYRTSHFAISTGIMALGAMLAGIVSGYLQVRTGWFTFFAAVCAFTVPGMLLLQRIPIERERLESSGAAALGEAGA